jgi:hypothetical protein
MLACGQRDCKGGIMIRRFKSLKVLSMFVVFSILSLCFLHSCGGGGGGSSSGGSSSGGGSLVNLALYQPQGWGDKVVVSNLKGSYLDTTKLCTSDTLYVDFAVINNGSVATAVTFYTELSVDGVLRETWQTDPPLQPNQYVYVSDYSIGSLSAGGHQIYIDVKTDSLKTNAIHDFNVTACGGGGNACSNCLSSCRGLSGCCTGSGCMCCSECGSCAF